MRRAVSYQNVLLPLLTLVFLAFATGCGSSSGGGATGAGAPELNPYGAAYPTENLGVTARRGDVAGNVIKNYKWQGYPGADASKGLQIVQLADYFDPEMRKYKVIHISVAGVWCVPCKEETKQVVPRTSELLAKEIVFLQALGDGAAKGIPATEGDLTTWNKTFGINFTTMLDPGVKNLGAFFDPSAIPWNANIDARTMEILSHGVGAPPDVVTEVTAWAEWVDAHPVKK